MSGEEEINENLLKHQFQKCVDAVNEIDNSEEPQTAEKTQVGLRFFFVLYDNLLISLPVSAFIHSLVLCQPWTCWKILLVRFRSLVFFRKTKN